MKDYVLFLRVLLAAVRIIPKWGLLIGATKTYFRVTS